MYIRVFICCTCSAQTQDKQSLYNDGVTVDNFEIQFTLTQTQREVPVGYDGNPAMLTDLRRTPILVFSGSQQLMVCTCVWSERERLW